MLEIAKIAEEMRRMNAEIAERVMALAEKGMAEAKAAGTPEALLAAAKAYERATRRVREGIKEDGRWARLVEYEARMARAKPAAPPARASILPKSAVLPKPAVLPKKEPARTAAPSSYPAGPGRTLHDWRNSN